MTLRAQVQRCQQTRLPYCAAHADADRRIKRGERQIWCRLCLRWKWPDTLCDIAREAIAKAKGATE